MVRAEVAPPEGRHRGAAVLDSLLMHFAEELDANVIVRGLRAVADFEYEFQMTAMNQRLNADIETVFLMADPRHQAIASRLVKEIARLDGAIESFVSPAVAERVRAKVQQIMKFPTSLLAAVVLTAAVSPCRGPGRPRTGARSRPKTCGSSTPPRAACWWSWTPRCRAAGGRADPAP